MTDTHQGALTRLEELRKRHDQLQLAGMEAFERNDLATLDAVIEEEHNNLKEQKRLIATLRDHA